VTEPEFVDLLRALPLAQGAGGLADDAATLHIGGETLVLTHDSIAEGVHYRAGTDPADIAWKLVAVNLSDLAAKGAVPIGVLIGATLIDGGERFVAGLREVLEAYSVPLFGGDTIALPKGAPAVFGCTAIGRASHWPVPVRSGARPGDGLWLCGELGAAMLGYEGSAGHLHAYLRPRPLLAEGIALAPHVHAMMDVSDGLLLDAARMAAASGCTIDIAAEAVPVSGSDRDRAMRWGDDYALLLAAPDGFEPPVPASRIGRVLPQGAEPLLVDGAAPTGPLGYQHG
jgi:thiamine-monophosphate kinase